MIQIINSRRFLFFILAFTLIIGLIMWATMLSDTKMKHNAELKVEKGDSAKVVWDRAVKAELTNSTFPWKYFAWRLDAADKIKTGTYQVEKGETISGVINRLTKGDIVPDELTITYPEGFTLMQIADRTSSYGIGSSEDFAIAASPDNFKLSILKDIPKGRNLEGYLFPDTYRVFKDDQASDVIKRMLENFNNKITDDLRSEIEKSNRTLDQVIIMASIIEREVLKDEDMALVSGILWKRFDEGVGLDADATVRYALSKWNKPLTYKDLQTDSAYNMRKYRGLPPGPISNPGIRAIIASIRPQKSEYYYYLSAPDGTTVFSKTNQEHNLNKSKYLR